MCPAPRKCRRPAAEDPQRLRPARRCGPARGTRRAARTSRVISSRAEAAIRCLLKSRSTSPASSGGGSKHASAYSAPGRPLGRSGRSASSCNREIANHGNAARSQRSSGSSGRGNGSASAAGSGVRPSAASSPSRAPVFFQTVQSSVGTAIAAGISRLPIAGPSRFDQQPVPSCWRDRSPRATTTGTPSRASWCGES
jgi:hypothetical protein